MLDLRETTLSPPDVCAALNLAPHPEGGHYRELWRDRPATAARGAASSILFLLAAGERSRWHRIDAAEVWLWHAGAPLLLRIHNEDTGVFAHRLGPDLAAGETLQGIVPARAWQEASSLGAWSLVGCVVAPAFEFAAFEMAPDSWQPVPR